MTNIVNDFIEKSYFPLKLKLHNQYFHTVPNNTPSFYHLVQNLKDRNMNDYFTVNWTCIENSKRGNPK